MGGRAGGRSTGNAVKVTPTVGSPGSSAPPADRHPKHVAGEFARKLVHAPVRVKGCSGSFFHIHSSIYSCVPEGEGERRHRC